MLKEVKTDGYMCPSFTEPTPCTQCPYDGLCEETKYLL